MQNETELTVVQDETELSLPGYEDLEAAQRRIAPYAVVTPLIEHPALNERLGARVLLKAENLQRVGAFKFRGAYNAISQIDRSEFPGGVVACSSGNHAQGVAAAATLYAMRSLIVMPSDAPALKLARTKRFGAEVVCYDRASEDREAIARAICNDRHAAFVHPFDNPHVVAGQGTVGLELMRQAAAVAAIPDVVLMPVSGGGLLAGVSLAIKNSAPDAQVYGVEPQGFDDFACSLASGRQQTSERSAGSICDALLSKSPGRIALAIARKTVTGGLTVSDAEAGAALRFAFLELKLVLEPSGAVALAAILSEKIPLRGKTVAAVLSGGNIDPLLFARIIQQPDLASG